MNISHLKILQGGADIMNFLGVSKKYAELGWRVFPIHGIKDGACTCGKSDCNSPGKHPALVKSWKAEATTDTATIEVWFDGRDWLNVGIATGKESGIVALDFDGYKEGAFSPDDMETECGCFISDIACVQNTGGGGQHMIFEYPEGETIGSRLKLRPGFDVKADGGYIVATPSKHHSGGVYAWDGEQNPWDQEIEILPEEATEFIKRHDSPPTLEIDNEPDQTPDFMRRLRCALFYIPADIGRDEWINVGMALQATGAASQAYNLWLLWSSTCPGKFTPNSMEHEWKSFDNAKGIHPELIFKIAEKYGWEDPEKNQLPEFILEEGEEYQLDEDNIIRGLRGFNETKKHRPEALWRDGCIFPGAKILIAGAPKTGKSFFALSLGVNAAMGGEFLEQKFERPVKTLWLQAEIHKGYLGDRMDLTIDQKTLTTEQIKLIDSNFSGTGRIRKDLTNPKDIIWLIHQMKSLEIELLIIDPIVNFIGGLSENDNNDVSTLFDKIDDIIERTNSAIAIIHHVSKSGTAKNTDIDETKRFELIRGASHFRGWYDTGFMMEKQDNGTVRAFFEMRNVKGMEPMTLKHDINAKKWAVIPDEITKNEESNVYEVDEIINTDDRLTLIKTIILENGGSITRKELLHIYQDRTDKKGRSESTFRKVIESAVKTGSLVRTIEANKATYFIGDFNV
ncbi:bifunctional DNA primase/polymerase (plasmid) [Shewanella sp. KX20019]|uniref:bifunctional DNA primase/polymerase n=1 Tax=Shewanella sp. KX20019 TaxID=2803864 RepID=UPI0019296504|nr:bifunctional DNA primase/polymerase [Shewanella sp. KX20019]QQX82708.1 bifunctional DNA primase/polymerase [Shewanella sp. KX20019]